MAREAE
ncbi:hypothetical protein YPPY29_1068, partial [Yersinia pestis PY-29]